VILTGWLAQAVRVRVERIGPLKESKSLCRGTRIDTVRKLLLASAIALLSITASAHASDWFMLNGETMRCEWASDLAHRAHATELTTPFLLEAKSRAAGLFTGTSIHRTSGTADAVVVHENLGAQYLFFASRIGCDTARAAMLADGTVTDPMELK
jgi:hypothetical protein